VLMVIVGVACLTVRILHTDYNTTFPLHLHQACLHEDSRSHLFEAFPALIIPLWRFRAEKYKAVHLAVQGNARTRILRSSRCPSKIQGPVTALQLII